MYAKLFGSVITSSLTQMVPIEIRGIFFMMLAIADRDGNVPGTDSSLARVINVPIDLFKSAIELLMAPDPESQSPEEDGRRVMRLEGAPGYRLVNYSKYSGIQTDQERRAYLRDKKRESRARLEQREATEQPSIAAEIPSESEVINLGGMRNIPPDYCRHYHAICTEKHRWLVGPAGNEKLVGWQSEITRWWARDQASWGKKSDSSDTFWKDKTKLELVERELDAIKARASHTASGMVIEAKDRERYDRLRKERAELKQRLGL